MRSKTLTEVVENAEAGADFELCKKTGWPLAHKLFVHRLEARALTDEMRKFLTFTSPGEFASRNIFTEERPLRRAHGPIGA